MDEQYLACVYSQDSGGHAILADNGVTGILYLHAPRDDPAKTGEVEATCFAYNRVDPIDTKEVQRFRPGPPPIAKGYASKDAVCRRPASHRWNLKFSSDGTAVLLLKNARPWSMVSLAAPHGFSKAVAAPGPWGGPWSDEVYNATKWSGRAKRCT